MDQAAIRAIIHAAAILVTPEIATVAAILITAAAVTVHPRPQITVQADILEEVRLQPQKAATQAVHQAADRRTRTQIRLQAAVVIPQAATALREVIRLLQAAQAAQVVQADTDTPADTDKRFFL